jgi:hypothetical protein
MVLRGASSAKKDFASTSAITEDAMTTHLTPSAFAAAFRMFVVSRTAGPMSADSCWSARMSPFGTMELAWWMIR